ncbi:glucose-1-phosphate adenylyltransferase subunit GlgD [Heyndrickxia ginsengihumi]|uniref:Glucose-1-phosphate adenylyltransferase n=1 Tax=Heyndrickxia ginsengihumi TaxID=363870 RepID=A0A0A6XW46_9BACI|nr:glucose-1-phosphate adenylyltransferase subunit GlgD [Heyndrickxia ginsengihumi]KHD84352.1 glucose-1-phosphate adenylyltransferase [Heyndrickxia ginsengihumi]MBE6185256.1 glucose-1-phosphate adenylyltransferase subunit GlgD [Bacillus sp. (in: firmicutes)]MCM3023423.1 glucose-1-phosphate adenylyltransferase subunit GlgD [Heyndrickxia ginsengihumi]NEY21570.1 glucose-1-phosphate adenylyltransferase subunit GlgD [Heyndrickxia ginsengihumi]
MTNILGVINLINEKPILKELTHHRCLAAIPFGGRYRLIDFNLSNFIHADVSSVAVFTKDKGRAIMDHLGSGKEWDLDRHNGGLFILPTISDDHKVKGDLQQFYDHIEFFERSSAEYVVITPGHHVSKLDMKELVDYHQQTNADITVVYKKYDGKPIQKPNYHKCFINPDGDIDDIELYTNPKIGDNICLETYVISIPLLINLIKHCIDNHEYDFLKDIVKANIQHLNIKGFAHLGPMLFIHSVESYHDSNMSLLNPEVVRTFFYHHWDIFTKLKHEPPTKFGESSRVSNSLIANGCEIHGEVENCIIFRGVKIKKGAIVKNSIIMQKTQIEEDVMIDNIITDKQVTITKNAVIIGTSCPKVIKKRETV